jgi:hypothetical protein
VTDARCAAAAATRDRPLGDVFRRSSSVLAAPQYKYWY